MVGGVGVGDGGGDDDDEFISVIIFSNSLFGRQKHKLIQCKHKHMDESGFAGWECYYDKYGRV